MAGKGIVYIIRWWGVDRRGTGYTSLTKINGQRTMKGTMSMLQSMCYFTNAQWCHVKKNSLPKLILIISSSNSSLGGLILSYKYLATTHYPGTKYWLAFLEYNDKQLFNLKNSEQLTLTYNSTHSIERHMAALNQFSKFQTEPKLKHMLKKQAFY